MKWLTLAVAVFSLSSPAMACRNHPPGGDEPLAANNSNPGYSTVVGDSQIQGATYPGAAQTPNVLTNESQFFQQVGRPNEAGTWSSAIPE